jgi:predicted Fe-S protein YdhL (DUF1289 family)
VTLASSRVSTPCIGVCSTGIGDVVCRGCKRFAHEVIGWNGYSEAEKQAIESRLDLLLGQIVAGKVEVVDGALLADQLEVQRVRYRRHRSPYCWVFDLLRAGAGQIDDPLAFGFRVQPGYQRMTLVELREQIDQEFFVLSEAHYQRYLAPV